MTEFNPDNHLRFILVKDLKVAKKWMKDNNGAYHSRMIDCEGGLYIQYYHRSLDVKPGAGRLA